MKKLVLFDFDGTITTKDTLIEFIRFYRGRHGYWFGLFQLAPILALYAARIIPNWKAKQFLLAQYFRGEDVTVFNRRCLEFSTAVLPSLIRPQALEALRRYKQEHATIAVVSASAENWVKPWCDAEGVLCLATRLETVNGAITGNFDGRNCYGDEKVCRIREHFDPSGYGEVIAYGDSSGDREMLAMASVAHYKPFRNSAGAENPAQVRTV